jgi:hypothetical protein
MTRRTMTRARPGPSSRVRFFLPAAAALTLLALLPTVAWAWTPGTHILLGEAVLRSAALLPPAVAALLRAHPHDFLYGSIAADTSIAKKYAKFGRHCHSWAVGLEILEEARDEPVRAFGYGYLAHLAADAVAHNFFVPHQLAVTSSTSALGHSYWESRFETHIGDSFPRRAHEIVLLDHVRSDEHLDRILSPTIFSTPTNRRIFRGMVYVTDTESWQRIFTLMADASRWDLEEREVARYLARSFDFVMDFLVRDASSEPYRLDPSGDRALRAAKLVRRAAKRRGGDDAIRAEAEREFGLPESGLAFARALAGPLYVPALAPRS